MRPGRVFFPILVLFAAGVSAEPLVELGGRDFYGGGASRFGYDLHVHRNVNYVYAGNTGLATMTARFQLAEIPLGTMALALEGLANDIGPPCPIEIAANGVVLFKGVPPYLRDRWDWWRFSIPAGTLRSGTNEIRITNLSPEGEPGRPPWFMVRTAMIGVPADLPSPADFEPFCEIEEVSRRDAKTQRALGGSVPGADGGDSREDAKTQRVSAKIGEVPARENLGESDNEGGRFRIRGMKGMLWLPETYLEEIPFLARHRFNFLMNCYTTLWDLETDGANRWYQALPEKKMEGMQRVVEACAENSIEFCYSINPVLNSSRPFPGLSGSGCPLVQRGFR
jgi:hypothetical protein